MIRVSWIPNKVVCFRKSLLIDLAKKWASGLFMEILTSSAVRRGFFIHNICKFRRGFFIQNICKFQLIRWHLVLRRNFSFPPFIVGSRMKSIILGSFHGYQSILHGTKMSCMIRFHSFHHFSQRF